MVDKRFVIFAVAVFCSHTGINSIYPLISSLNIEEGIGTTSLAVGYATALVVTLFTPGLFQLIGAKKVFVTSQVCYISFLFGNMYTSFFTMIPAGVMLGIGEGTFWSSMSVTVSYFSQLAAKSENNCKQSRSRHTGYIFTAVQAGVVNGNVISFVFLLVDRTISKAGNFTQIMDYSYCGANDCQIENITNANINLYKPSFPATRYLLIIFAALMITVAITLEIIYLPKAVRDIDTAPLNAEANNVGIDNNVVCDVADIKKLNSSDRKNTDLETTTQSPVTSDGSTINDSYNSNNIGFPKQANKAPSAFRTIFKSLIHIKRLFFTPKHLLVMLMPIYNGMVISFVYGDLTRSFGSCVLGVDKVAAASVVFGAADTLFSYISGKVAAKFGRNWPFVFAFLLDMASYITSLKWEITEHNTGMVYVLFLFFGMSDGIWQTLINDMYGSYFEDKTAYVLWNLLIVFGLTLQYALSKVLCVYIKIYMQIALLGLAVSFYGLLQILSHNESHNLPQSPHNPKPEKINTVGL